MKYSFLSKTKYSQGTKLNSESTGFVQLHIRMSTSSDNGDYKKIETRDVANYGEYKLNYNYWELNTRLRSSNNYDEEHFRNIKSRRVEYLPYIYDDLVNGDITLIRALEYIFPELCPYKGYISTELAKRKWLRILKEQKQNYENSSLRR